MFKGVNNMLFIILVILFLFCTPVPYLIVESIKNPESKKHTHGNNVKYCKSIKCPYLKAYERELKYKGAYTGKHDYVFQCSRSKCIESEE